MRSDEGELYYRCYWVSGLGVKDGYGYRKRDFGWADSRRREEGLDFIPDFYIVEEVHSALIAISDESHREEIERHLIICAWKKKYTSQIRLADEKKSKEMLEIVEKYLADKKG